MQVPHLERVVLRGGDEDGLHRVKGQSSNPIKMAAQSEFGVPCFSHGVLVVANLRRGHPIRTSDSQHLLHINRSPAVGAALQN